MAKAIIVTTPTTTHPLGKLTVLETDPEPWPNPFKAFKDDELFFKDPGIPLTKGDIVDFAMIAEKTCNVTKVLEPAK